MSKIVNINSAKKEAPLKILHNTYIILNTDYVLIKYGLMYN